MAILQKDLEIKKKSYLYGSVDCRLLAVDYYRQFYMQRKDFEIMAPAGSWESLQAAIQAGADSVYFGIERLNMRSRSSSNFTTEDLHRIVERCKEAGIKSYLTINTII